MGAGQDRETVKQTECLLIGHKTYEQYKDEYPLKSGATTFVYTHDQSYEDQGDVVFLRDTPEKVLCQTAERGSARAQAKKMRLKLLGGPPENARRSQEAS